MKHIIIIGLFTSTLLALPSCSIVKKNKEIEKENIDTSSSEKFSKTEVSEEVENTSINQSSFDLSKYLNFDYKPLFDASGNYIPFIIEHSVNGKSERITIQGAGVTGSTSEKKSSSTYDSKKYIFRKNIIETKYITHTTYKTETKKLKKDKFAFGLDPLLSILLFGLIILLVILAISGHWTNINKLLTKFIKFINQ